VKQQNPSNKQWHTISHYSKSGNFLGAAIFDTKQEAHYLKEYEAKMLSHLVSIRVDLNSDISQKQQQQRYHNNNIITKKRGKGRPGRNGHIKLKVFQESTLPPVDKPSFFFHQRSDELK
jgi:hypothetical protein